MLSFDKLMKRCVTDSHPTYLLAYVFILESYLLQEPGAIEDFLLPAHFL